MLVAEYLHQHGHAESGATQQSVLHLRWPSHQGVKHARTSAAGRSPETLLKPTSQCARPGQAVASSGGRVPERELLCMVTNVRFVKLAQAAQGSVPGHRICVSAGGMMSALRA